jgi:hypothetical protein
MVRQSRLKKADIKPHDLRRTYGTWYFRLGRSPGMLGPPPPCRLPSATPRLLYMSLPLPGISPLRCGHSTTLSGPRPVNGALYSG